MTKLIIVLTIGLTVGTCALLTAEGLEVPPGDPLAALLALVTNFGAMSPIAIASGVIVFVVQALRSFLPASVPRKAIVVLLGVAYALVQKVMGGIGWVDAGVMVLLTSGGAVALYEWVVKPLLPKTTK